uniref:glucuronosyltransferase n=1 Tax=Ditylenchus dipsaci TaxID=166011 RepID=A0A915CMY2_9BILA
MHYKQIGVHLDILKTHQSQVIIDGLNKVLNDPIYKQNVKLLQKKIQLNPFPPKEQLVKWVEFAAEFPELNELNLPSIEDFGYMKYYCLDVIAAGFIVLGLGLWTIYWMAKQVRNRSVKLLGLEIRSKNKKE